MRKMTRRLERSWMRDPLGLGLLRLALACACLMAVGRARGQETAAAGGSESPTRLLTRGEGRAIVNVAWQQELPARGVRDCSHVVHEIYANAGFEYPYASSFEIYAGDENFARVKYPRTGDVIAWPGHVGIVVDPVLHSFYSLVRTGLEEQNYQSAYWRSRGRPRFFRFRVASGAMLSAARVASTSGDSIRTDRPFVGPVRENRGDADAANSDRPPSAVAKGSAAKNSARDKLANAQGPSTGSTSDDDRVAAVNHSSPDRPPTASPEKSSAIYGPPTPPAGGNWRAAEDEEENDEVTPFEMPKSVILATSGKAPTREEMAEGISELSDAFGSVLRRDDPFQAQQPVVIVEQFRVEKVEIKRDRGWAHLAIDSKVLVGGGTVQVKRRHDKVRWELRRTDSGWEALTPADRMYVPHDVAVKNLAAQLARIAASDGAAQHQDAVLRQETQLAKVLSALLEDKQ